MNHTGYRPRNRFDPEVKRLAKLRAYNRNYHLKRKLDALRRARLQKPAPIPRQVILSIQPPLKGSIALTLPISTKKVAA